MITTTTQLTKATRKARTMAACLRQPGARFGSIEERMTCAELLDQLSDVAERGAKAAGVNDA